MPHMWSLSGDEQRSGVSLARPSSNVVVVTVHGPVDTLEAPRLRELLRHRLIACVQAVVVDLTDVSFVNSLGVEVLSECALRAADQGVLLRVVCVPGGRVERLIDLAGMRDRFALRFRLDTTLAELPTTSADASTRARTGRKNAGEGGSESIPANGGH